MSGDYFDQVVAGPALLYTGTLGAITTPPADAAVNSAPAASAWNLVVGTMGGVTWSQQDKNFSLSVDQVPIPVDDRVQETDIQVVTTIAAASLMNLALALNTTIGATGANYVSLDGPTGTSATQRQPISLVIDGYAPALSSGLATPRRRLYLPRCKQFGKVQAVYAKDKQVGWDVTFTAYYVNDQTPPYHITDQTA